VDTLNYDQKTEVGIILRKHQQSFPSIPGLCVENEYELEVEDHVPLSDRERPIPYAIREAIREEIDMGVEQGIIGTAMSPYSNALVIISKANEDVSTDPDCAAFILTYPVPKNQKQLRQLLGNCNFHHKFIVRYAENAAPLMPLLRKGVKWKMKTI
jgi:hypothetical protein